MIILNQFGRRNINIYQRSVLALEFEKLFKEKAKENQIKAGKEFGKGLQNSAKAINAIDTRQELAKKAEVSHDTIMRVKKIQEAAPVEIKEKVQAGDMSINEAYKKIKAVEKQ